MGESNTAVPTAASVKFDYNRSSVVLLIFGIYAAFLLCVDEAIEHNVGSGLYSVFLNCFFFFRESRQARPQYPLGRS